jgi:hypothetical protein
MASPATTGGLTGDPHDKTVEQPRDLGAHRVERSAAGRRLHGLARAMPARGETCEPE